jgi:hypothetical protein
VLTETALEQLVYRATGGEARVLTSTVQVKASDAVWLVEEIRRLRRERDSLLLDRSVYRERANRTETR